MEYNILKIEKQPRKSGGPRIVYHIKCTNPDCGNIVKYRKSELNRWSGLCLSCFNRKRPFESLYNTFKNANKPRIDRCPIEISYEDFLEYTKITECHYCNSKIHWEAYSTVNGKYLQSGYFLDRMNSSKGYSKDNIVVCCSRCNFSKNDKFSYEEWYGMTKYFRDRI